MCVDGWLVARKRYCFFFRGGSFVASAILPFILYSSTMKAGSCTLSYTSQSPIPSFHEVMIDDLSHPYSFLSVKK